MANFTDMECDISASESHAELKEFKRLSLNEFRGSNDKCVSKKGSQYKQVKYKATRPFCLLETIIWTKHFWFGL